MRRVVTCASAFFESPEENKLTAKSGGNNALPLKVSDDQCSTSSSSTSSIGRNSDLSSDRSTGDEDCGENEVQSAYNGPLDMMESLEEVLPIRRGISKFYNGKSKSFTSLADASFSPSLKDITKPENAYTRRRRNLMAFNHIWEKNRSFPLRSNGGGICKRTISSSRSTLALAVAMNNCDSNSSTTSEDSNSRSPPPLPPLHPGSRVSTPTASAGPSSPLQQNFSAWRSFSLVDLQHCATAASINMSTTAQAALKEPQIVASDLLDPDIQYMKQTSSISNAPQETGHRDIPIKMVGDQYHRDLSQELPYLCLQQKRECCNNSEKVKRHDFPVYAVRIKHRHVSFYNL
ncbi:serine/arginine repetitive matrix protein 2 [Senna tora]|uniref:Serine/arginine repetitive matrix protein 2 n=1 Tax=Senna tora TaxID=362788 RepID=A0A834T8V5_9FABA|nr:serine/arginine repetitive matrix protein 2 [Senna tora]